MNTLITLKYVDADNYKQSIEFVLAGEITDEQITTISAKLEDGECIIAQQLGLPTPSEKMAELHTFPTESDHVFTTIEEFQDGLPKAIDMLTDDVPTIPDYSADTFVMSILSVTEWDIQTEMTRLGMS